MRSFEERKAELFRRQELYLERQKKRNAIIRNSISGIVCVAILGAMLGEGISYMESNRYKNHYYIVNTCTKDKCSSSAQWDEKIAVMQSSMEVYIYNENIGKTQMAVCFVLNSDVGEMELEVDTSNLYAIAEVESHYYVNEREILAETMRP